VSRPAIFLDRDGVINADHGYVYQWSDFEILPGVEQALAALQAMGYALVIVTNQSGIGRGLYNESDVESLHNALREHLAKHNIELSGIYFCPHHPSAAKGAYLQDCTCRKPAPGLLLAAGEELNIDFSRSVMVGDKSSDMEAGRRAGLSRLFWVNDQASDTIADVTRVASLAQLPALLSSVEGG